MTCKTIKTKKTESKIYNILLIVDDYLPKSTKVAAKMMHELALEFRIKGHQVSVLTPQPSLKNKKEISNIDGVKVIYFRSGPLKNTPFIKRAINEYLLSQRAIKNLSWDRDVPNVDIIVYYSPSIFWSYLVHFLKKKYNARSYLILRDIFPKWAIDSGIISAKSPITRFFKYYEKKNYFVADKIGVMSPKNLELFKKEIYLSNNVEVLYNWIKIKEFNVKIDPKIKINLGDKTIFFYGGTIGHAQDIQNLIDLAYYLQDVKDCHFLFMGNGDEENIVIQAAEKNENITYLPSVSQEDYQQYLNAADVCLFSLNKLHKTHNFPGKILNYMNASKPILGLVNDGNDIISMFNSKNAGFIFGHENKDEFLKSGRKLVENQSLRNNLGKAGNKLLKNYFSVENTANQILNTTYT